MSFRETLNVAAMRQCELEHTSARRNVKDPAKSMVPSLNGAQRHVRMPAAHVTDYQDNCQMNRNLVLLGCAAVLSSLVGLSGCTSDVLLQKDNKIVTCEGGCAKGGLAGIPCRNTQRECVEDFQKAGYERIQ